MFLAKPYAMLPLLDASNKVLAKNEPNEELTAKANVILTISSKMLGHHFREDDWIK